MPDSSPAGIEPAVVLRLRAAGCVFAEDEARLLVDAAGTATELDTMVDRRVAGVPLEHVLGWAEFCGVRIQVAPGVFVPRRRSEFLVDQAVALTRPRAVVIDLCCGSGALGIAVQNALGYAEVYAVDVDPEAVACARNNLAGRGTVLLGDLFDPLPERLHGRADLVLANVPYVPTAHLDLLPPEARLHERHLALDGGVDGLDVLRRVASGALQWLRPGGHLLFEIVDAQAPAAVGATVVAGLTAWVVTSEESETTVLVARRPTEKGLR